MPARTTCSTSPRRRTVMRYVILQRLHRRGRHQPDGGRRAEKSFRIWIIPHTFEVTALRERKVGDAVNLEADLLGKYVEKVYFRPPSTVAALRANLRGRNFAPPHGNAIRTERPSPYRREPCESRNQAGSVFGAPAVVRSCADLWPANVFSVDPRRHCV